ncbi:MAG: hypothetical protein LBU51_10580, partial [Bacteroidales bacterium]|nr:hypothetical protein [Bacteroidales bacterium]
IWQKNIELALGFGISTQTVSKWRNRSSLKNLSSRPHTIHYGLSAICMALWDRNMVGQYNY